MKQELLSGKLRLPLVIIRNSQNDVLFLSFEADAIITGMYLYSYRILQIRISGSNGNGLIHLHTQSG